MCEGIAVAAARGITMPGDLIEKHLAFAGSVPSHWKTSMCNDLEAGKSIELEATSGALHRMGLAHGVPTPNHDFIYRALKAFAAPMKLV